MTPRKSTALGKIRVGIGGWTYPPWRGNFYPKGLPQKDELSFAARHLTSIEINGTYYRSQSPASFAKWHDETPNDFVFAVKGPRFATNRRVLAEAGSSIERFFGSGVLALKNKLGPVNWQLMPTKTFDAEDFEAFLSLLPGSVEGRAIRHAVEVRHASFAGPDFVALARKHGVGIVIAGDAAHPQIADPTAPFAYLRIMGSEEGEALGYTDKAFDAWAARARALAAGEVPADLATVGKAPAGKTARDVFLSVISGATARNPAAAMALIERLG